MPHPLLDGFDKPKQPPATVDEHVINKLLGLLQTDGTHSVKVRWLDYGPKGDTWEHQEYLPRDIVVQFFRQNKKRVSGYDWQART